MRKVLRNDKSLFVKGLGFTKTKSIIFQDLCFHDCSDDDIAFPISKQVFLKDHLVARTLWWDDGSERYYESLDDIIEHYETEWKEYLEKNNLRE